MIGKILSFVDSRLLKNTSVRSSLKISSELKLDPKIELLWPHTVLKNIPDKRFSEKYMKFENLGATLEEVVHCIFHFSHLLGFF